MNTENVHEDRPLAEPAAEAVIQERIRAAEQRQQQPSEPSPWLDIADELERIAKDCRDLVGEPAPALFGINIQPSNPDHGSHERTAKNRPAIVAACDAVAAALLGKPTNDKKMHDGTFHRDASGDRGPVRVHVYTSVAGPNAAVVDEELARLREENARLRAASGLDHSRDDGPVDAHAGRVPAHLEDGRNPGEAC